jgi:hypothetical protein
VTRLECPASGVVIEGRFSLGWIGALTPEQLSFAGQLLRHRGNVQKLAGELNVAYNTARSRLDGIVAALGAPAGPPEGGDAGGRPGPAVAEILDRLAQGELDFAEALRLLRG